MNNNYYPRYFSESEAKCFNCGQYIDDVQDAGYKPGNGEKLGHCEHCGMHTWFDVIANVKAVSDKLDSLVTEGGPHTRMYWKDQER